MARIVITAPADADTAEIIHELGIKAGANVVARYLADFDRLFDRLARFSESGAPRHALGRRIRIGVVLPYIIIHEYDDANDTVNILRIVYGPRRITRQLLGRGER